MTVETLAAQLRQCILALEEIRATGIDCFVCDARTGLVRERHTEPCPVGKTLDMPVPSDADLATLARQAEIGALVERMKPGQYIGRDVEPTQYIWVVLKQHVDSSSLHSWQWISDALTIAEALGLANGAALNAADKDSAP